ncbi:MAG: ice-binding family protein [Candidatus Baltobacteraceae bacterium]
MLKLAFFSGTKAISAIAVLALLAGCSGGCGNCTVPAYHTPPVPSFTPTPTPPPPPPVGTLACTQGPSAITLGPALAPFAILAGSAVSNVGNTLVTYGPSAITAGVHDDLIGVSPGTAVTGFPPGSDADGPNAIYAAGFNPNTAVPLAAQNALTTAYTTAAGVPATATVAGDLGGQVLAPGVYKSTSSLAIGNGNLTLDGGGNAQSVFLFQIASTLTTTLNGSAGGNVVLRNGATACNVFWQVGSSATLGGSTFYGDILAFSSITINAPSFTGRALAGGSALGSGAVSIPVLSGSLITNPGGR